MITLFVDRCCQYCHVIFGVRFMAPNEFWVLLAFSHFTGCKLTHQWLFHNFHYLAPKFCLPPSIAMHSPVINAAFLDARKDTNSPTSSGWATRLRASPRGWVTWMDLSRKAAYASSNKHSTSDHQKRIYNVIMQMIKEMHHVGAPVIPPRRCKGVSTTPGFTTFTRMLKGARSRLEHRDNWSRAALDAQ